jgi:hypothetical protein
MRLSITLLLILSGCSTASQVIPSLKYCDHVFYERVKADITLRAECTLPSGIDAPL